MNVNLRARSALRTLLGTDQIDALLPRARGVGGRVLRVHRRCESSVQLK